ncbi:MAG: hypothetical protein QGH45_16005 [Myxococcota bacterium]|nr:hypothetical protein [Myxococcota bacterium]
MSGAAGRPLGDVAVSFSGGLDTTLAVVQLLDVFERVHLLTYCNGYCFRIHAHHDRVRALREAFGAERIVSRTEMVRSQIDELLEDYWKDLHRTGSPLIFDLACRFSMEVATIQYCLENDISHAADGLNSAQPVIFILEPDYIRMADAFMAEFGIQFLHPVYHFGDRGKRRELLDRHGLNVEVKLISFVQRAGILPQISEQILTQPFCYAQVPIFFLTSPLRHAPLLRRFGLATDDARAYRGERQRVARELLARFVSELGGDLRELLDRRGAPDDARDHFPAAL